MYSLKAIMQTTPEENILLWFPHAHADMHAHTLAPTTHTYTHTYTEKDRHTHTTHIHMYTEKDRERERKEGRETEREREERETISSLWLFESLRQVCLYAYMFRDVTVWSIEDRFNNKH